MNIKIYPDRTMNIDGELYQFTAINLSKTEPKMMVELIGGDMLLIDLEEKKEEK